MDCAQGYADPCGDFQLIGIDSVDEAQLLCFVSTINAERAGTQKLLGLLPFIVLADEMLIGNRYVEFVTLLLV